MFTNLVSVYCASHLCSIANLLFVFVQHGLIINLCQVSEC